jgi:hypothetical protein
MITIFARSVALVSAIAAATLSVPFARAADLPIFDAHIHYNRDAWGMIDAAGVTAKMRAAGVKWGLVSSTPDDGTLELFRVDAKRFVPSLRPYRTPADRVDWFESKDVLAYLEARIGRVEYRAIGEFHLHSPDQARTHEMRRIAALAHENGIHLYVHSGPGPVEVLSALRPGLKVLWAHAGMSTPPEEVGAVLDRHGLVAVELSFRAGDIMPGDTMHPAWRSLLLRHSDRFVIGSDTYTPSQWDDYRGLIAEHRRWLNKLPEEAAQAIAWRNAHRLLGLDGGPRR